MLILNLYIYEYIMSVNLVCNEQNVMHKANVFTCHNFSYNSVFYIVVFHHK